MAQTNICVRFTAVGPADATLRLSLTLKLRLSNWRDLRGKRAGEGLLLATHHLLVVKAAEAVAVAMETAPVLPQEVRRH